jgi:catechol 2,3-dioxygenase-like lactoylglutathione lyase family enzyme
MNGDDLTLALVSVPVSDQQRALDFYTHALGLDIITDTTFEQGDAGAMRWVQLEADHGTGIALVTWFPTMQPGSIKGLVFETSDLDGTIDRLAARGVAFTPTVDAPWARFTTFEDPDGNGWVLQQPKGLV